jgi:hypothetical protein
MLDIFVRNELIAGVILRRVKAKNGYEAQDRDHQHLCPMITVDVTGGSLCTQISISVNHSTQTKHTKSFPQPEPRRTSR